MPDTLLDPFTRPDPDLPEAERFAEEAIRTICASGVGPSAASHAWRRCRQALAMGATARAGFRHPGKAKAIDFIWRERERLHREFRQAPDKLSYLETLPGIGPVTRSRLARGLGLETD